MGSQRGASAHGRTSQRAAPHARRTDPQRGLGGTCPRGESVLCRVTIGDCASEGRGNCARSRARSNRLSGPRDSPRTGSGTDNSRTRPALPLPREGSSDALTARIHADQQPCPTIAGPSGDARPLHAIPAPGKALMSAEKPAFPGPFCFIGETGSIVRLCRVGATYVSDLLRVTSRTAKARVSDDTARCAGAGSRRRR
jgi:hypothetical protein